MFCAFAVCSVDSRLNNKMPILIPTKTTITNNNSNKIFIGKKNASSKAITWPLLSSPVLSAPAS